jgi:streptogramin lyase
MRSPIPTIRWPVRNLRRRRLAPRGPSRKPAPRLLVEALESRRLLSVTINEFPVTKPSNVILTFITTGPDGDLWFSELNGAPGAGIGRLDPNADVITDIPTGSPTINPLDLTTGPDGNIWFTDSSDNQIGEINPTTFAINVFPLPASFDPD